MLPVGGLCLYVVDAGREGRGVSGIFSVARRWFYLFSPC